MKPVLPCPFCGKRCIAFKSDLPPTDFRWTIRHEVGGCVWYFSLAFKTRAEAVAAFNQRTNA